MICLDECQATRTRLYALFDDTNVLHTFYQYLTHHCHRSCFDDLSAGRPDQARSDNGIGEPGTALLAAYSALAFARRRRGAKSMQSSCVQGRW
jgi:hypothetical protein